MLPEDVVETVLECLYRDNAWSSIKTCAFVSPTFRQLAHKHIFSSVTLEYHCYPGPIEHGMLVLCEWPKDSAGHRLLALLDRAPYISRYIREVKFIAAAVPKSHAEQEVLTAAVQAEMRRLGVSEYIFEDGTSAIPLTLETILHRLPNLKSLKLQIGKSFGLFWSTVHPKSQDAIVEVCRNQLEEFACNTVDFAEFPYKKLRGSKHLKRVYVDGLFDIKRPTTLDEVRPSDSPCVLDSFEFGLRYPDQASTKLLPNLFTTPDTIFNLSSLRRLVINNSTSVDHCSAIALCASTLEELEINLTGNNDCLAISTSLYPEDAFGLHGNPNAKTLDFTDLRVPRLRHLSFVIPVVFYSDRVYQSALAWVGTSLETIPDDSPLETLSVVLQGSLIPGVGIEQKILKPVDLGVIVDLVVVDDEEGSMGVKLRVQGLQSVFVHSVADPDRDSPSRSVVYNWETLTRSHGDLESLRKLGLLRTPSST